MVALVSQEQTRSIMPFKGSEEDNSAETSSIVSQCLGLSCYSQMVVNEELVPCIIGLNALKTTRHQQTIRVREQNICIHKMYWMEIWMEST